MNLKEQYEKIRLLTWIVIQDIMFFLINKVFQCILHFREDFRLISDYFPLKIVDIKSPYTFEQHSSNSYEDHFPIEEHQTIKTNHTIPVHILVPLKSLIDISHSSYLLHSMLSLTIITSISLGSMERKISLLKNIFKVLRII